MSSWGGGIIRLKKLSLRVPHKIPDHGRFSLRARQRSGSSVRDTRLRQVDVLVSQGRKVAEAIRSSEVTDATYYRWRSEYGGLKGRSGQAAEVPGDREPTTSSGNRRPDPGDAHSHGGGFGTQRAAPAKLLSAACRNASPAVSWAGIVRRSAGLPSRSRSHRRPPSSLSLCSMNAAATVGSRPYNSIRPHSSLGYQPPVPEVVIWPTEPSGSAPLAHPAIVTRPTMP